VIDLREKPKGLHDILYALTVIFAFVAVPLSCWAGSSLFVEFGTSFVHLDRIVVNGELYQLAYISQPTEDKSSYNLYRCDGLGFTCERIYHLDTASGILHADAGNFQSAEKARLMSDASNRSLSIVIEGTTIGDYRLREPPS